MAYSKKMRLYFVIILVAGWVITLTLRQIFQEQKLYHQTRVLMGTFFEVISPDRRAGKIVFDEVDRLEQLLSKYKVDSEVSRLNRLGKITASSDTFYIIKRAKEFTQKTNGAFDITVAPLMDLWGFTERNFSVPSEIKIKQSLQLVGSDKIILHENSNVIEFKLSGMKIDLGGIAKGYALDCAVEKLKANHINSCLINAGGQVFAMGRKFGSAWKIALRPPRSNQIKEYLRLSDKSVSTSGDYEQYFIKGNKRYAHILDPKTGSPADAKILSVSVIADNALTADALSTAIFVLGRDKSKDIIKAFPGLETRIYENDQ